MRIYGVLLLLCSCASNPPSASSEPKKIEYPDWVEAGSGAFAAPREVFRGVASGADQPTAEARARKEVSKPFEVYSASIMKEYGGAGASMKSIEEMEQIEKAVKQASKESLEHIELSKRWTAPDRKVFCLAQLELEHFLQAIRSSALKPAAQEEFVQKARKDFIDLTRD